MWWILTAIHTSSNINFHPFILLPFSNLSLYIPIVVSLPPLLPSPPSRPLPPRPLSCPEGKPLRVPAHLAHHVSGGLSSSSPTEVRQGSPVRVTGSTGRQQSQRRPSFQLLGDPHEDRAAHLLHMCGGPRSTLCMLVAHAGGTFAEGGRGRGLTPSFCVISSAASVILEAQFSPYSLKSS